MKPIAVKSLKRTDIQKQMTLPSKLLKCFPPLSGDKHTVDFPVRDECGRVWKFRIYARKKNKKYPKPVITKGWRDFVLSKQLCIGDRVVFYMEREGDSVEYHVRVEKGVKIFGGGFGSTPARASLARMNSEAKISSTNEAVRRMEMKMESMEKKVSLMENRIATMTSDMEKFLHNNGGSSNLMGPILGRLKIMFWFG